MWIPADIGVDGEGFTKKKFGTQHVVQLYCSKCMRYEQGSELANATLFWKNKIKIFFV